MFRYFNRFPIAPWINDVERTVSVTVDMVFFGLFLLRSIRSFSVCFYYSRYGQSSNGASLTGTGTADEFSDGASVVGSVVISGAVGATVVSVTF